MGGKWEEEEEEVGWMRYKVYCTVYKFFTSVDLGGGKRREGESGRARVEEREEKKREEGQEWKKMGECTANVSWRIKVQKTKLDTTPLLLTKLGRGSIPAQDNITRARGHTDRQNNPGNKAKSTKEWK